MSWEGIIWIVVDMTAIVGLYGWAICKQIDKENENSRSNENEPNNERNRIK